MEKVAALLGHATLNSIRVNITSGSTDLEQELDLVTK